MSRMCYDYCRATEPTYRDGALSLPGRTTQMNRFTLRGF